jgi:hypothetical protein
LTYVHAVPSSEISILLLTYIFPVFFLFVHEVFVFIYAHMYCHIKQKLQLDEKLTPSRKATSFFCSHQNWKTEQNMCCDSLIRILSLLFFVSLPEVNNNKYGKNYPWFVTQVIVHFESENLSLFVVSKKAISASSTFKKLEE